MSEYDAIIAMVREYLGLTQKHLDFTSRELSRLQHAIMALLERLEQDKLAALKRGDQAVADFITELAGWWALQLQGIGVISADGPENAADSGP